jgi:mannose-6-phosphate isomerase-like protein (cupin superfamily)
MFEHIAAGEQTLAYVFRAGSNPERTTFVTPDAAAFQAGFVVYGAGQEIPRHEHRQIERTVERTSEVLVIREGRCEVDLYDAERTLVRTLELRAGDIILLLGGGHGFRLLEDTVFFEVKQGPYLGDDEKERF